MNMLAKKVLETLNGALAIYHQETKRFHFIHCSLKTMKLLGYEKEPFLRDYQEDALGLLPDSDRPLIEEQIQSAIQRKVGIRIYSPVKETSSILHWFEMDGLPYGDAYYLLFGGISQETQLFENFSNENADDIYVIEKNTYNLLYSNHLKHAFWYEEGEETPKCYRHIYGKDAPCQSCSLKNFTKQKESDEMTVEENGCFYLTRFKEIEWNGIPAYIKYVRNVTEEIEVKRTKERLEKYFETVLKYLPGGVAVVHHGANGVLTPEYISNGFAEMVDMPMEETWRLYNESALAGVHPDDRAYVVENLNECIRQRAERETLQYRLKTGRGDYIWVHAQFSVIPLDEGDAMVYADYNDITQEKQEYLRKQYNNQIFQHYLITDPTALILGHCNITQNQIIEIEDRTHSCLLQRFGHIREEFFTGIGTLIVDPQERQQFYDRYLNEPSIRAFEKGINEIILPCFIQLPEKERGCYVQFKVNLVETPDTGDITGILTVSDITEKTIQDQIMKQLSSMNYDLVANVDLYNDYYEIVSGEDPNIMENQGKTSLRIENVVRNLIVDSEKEYFKDQLDPKKMMERLSKEGSYAFRYSMKDRDGKIYTKNMIVSAVDLRLGRVCLVRSDITEMLAQERKSKYELEKALTQAKEASQVKSDFLSSMSHDIRTPMNAIVGMTNLAKANIHDPDKMKEYLQKISVSSQHLLSLINDVLDMSQIEQSKIHMNLQPIHIDELIDQISSIMSNQAMEKNLQFHIKKQDIQQRCFQGDVLRIKQILINLLSDAFKFTNPFGTIDFIIHEIPASQEGHVRYQFIVADTGIGMQESFMKHIFEPFLRSEKVTKVEGTGLGLSITKGLVDRMGGTIQVTSKVNEGTTFTVDIEFEIAEEIMKTSISNHETALDTILKGKHFLVVEDNQINSEILEELLMMHGATCTIKEDGLQALNEFKDCETGMYDAIFMDIQMPKMNGYQATQAIRKLDRADAQFIVILAMTANAYAEDVQKALEAGMNGHISKPVDMKLLCSMLSKLLKEPL